MDFSQFIKLFLPSGNFQVFPIANNDGEQAFNQFLFISNYFCHGSSLSEITVGKDMRITEVLHTFA